MRWLRSIGGPAAAAVLLLQPAACRRPAGGIAIESALTHAWDLANGREIAVRTRTHLGSDDTPDHPYAVSNETVHVFVPETYGSGEPHGLLVWISPNDSGAMPPEWAPLMNEFSLIWAGPNHAGNQQRIHTRRLPLVLDTVHSLTNQYRIDPHRIYVAGHSGGGRVASLAAFLYPDVFDGGIFLNGVGCWANVQVGLKASAVIPPFFREPQLQYLYIIQRHGRYALVTGAHDFNQREIESIYRRFLRTQAPNCIYIEDPEGGHELPGVKWVKKALEHVTQP